ncbi:RNA polymerase subunit sigma-70 [Prauserella sp. PE36]|uniref:Sigma-70 family RNA polymerase sigma factor n=1 Tax=Prauserella endophytica TaxID=1592324 RepID=A0ABY2SCJ9_9PSEU|nr:MULTISPECIES: sigma-70 family RNA polymerase sigma factor [Prauserella]PXY35109.1 RNA polymerase subunit sigma-70 [Prauserella coralliicola]RBM21235.1 RNA polymerase subunit sigma-70 [Prauserella sp. PE36]TKG73642.1 sigma-70 family RNA polymerase sigma factor [Prauserella endophytica]
MSMPIAVAAGPGPARLRAVESAAPVDASVDENWDLVRAAQSGDTAAFGKLYDRYVDWVYRYVLLRVGDRHLAEDVTSETFLRALRRITSISYQGRDVGAWFTTIARNLVLDHVKSSRFRLEIVTDEVTESGTQPFGSSAQHSPGPEQQVISKTTNDELLRCIAGLGDDQRECIILRFIQGFSVSETAQIMQRNEGAVKALQHRAVRRLAKLLPTGLR